MRLSTAHARTRPTLEADVCVVGAGIVGVAHALEARRRGLSVVVLERHDRAVGASVRNFGHGFVAGMGDGAAFECALLARERWLELGRITACQVSESGSLIVARHEDELAVMRGVARDPRRRARLISPREAGLLAPIPTRGLVGALHTQGDIRVDPRRAVGQLAAFLEADPRATVLWATPAVAVEPGLVEATTVSVRADHVVLCPGPDYEALVAAGFADRPDVTRCKLQMLRVAGVSGRRYVPALLTGLSLLRYPAFLDQDGIEAVRSRLTAGRPELVAAGIHLIVTEQPNGDLIVGDTHDYAGAVSPFGDERLDELVLAEARGVLGVEQLDVRERWHGVYPAAAGEPFQIAGVAPGVVLVEVVSGVGMTTALGLAPRVLDGLLGDSGAL